MTKSKEITKTYFSFSSPIFKSDGTYFTYGDTIAIIDYKNYSLYELHDISTVEGDTATIEKKVINRYFLHKKKDSYGYYYNSLDDKIGRKTLIDTFLTKRAFYGQTFFNSSIMELIDFKKNKKGFELIEKYKCKTKVDLTYSDSVIVYYNNKLRNISFSLSKELDSIKNMKVQKIRLIYNSQFVQGYPNKFPAYEYKFELKEDSITNLEKYKLFIDEKNRNAPIILYHK